MELVKKVDEWGTACIPNAHSKVWKVRKKSQEENQKNMTGPKIIACLHRPSLPKWTIWRFSARSSICVWNTHTSLRKRLLGKSTWPMACNSDSRQGVVEMHCGLCHLASRGSCWSPGAWTSQPSYMGTFSPWIYCGLCKQSKPKGARRERGDYLTGWSVVAESSKPYVSNF